MSQLAIDGGPPACTDLPSWPHYEADEIEAVAEVLRSGKVNQWTGPDVKAFEAACAKRFGTPYAVAVANGTVALEVALRALGVGRGDEVIVTPRSFFASAGCVPFVGAIPVFADIDLNSQNMTAASIAACITPKTKAIIPVHLNGWPCDMPEIMELARAHNLLVIEDCAQAHGAGVDGKSVGSFGDAAAFSFCQDKIMSTGGEGGVVLFREDKHWRAGWSFKDHGKDMDAVFTQHHPPGFRWVTHGFGTNGRMPGLQAAIGLKQLEKLDDWRTRRWEIFETLRSCLTSYSAVQVPVPRQGILHAGYRFGFSVEPTRLAEGWDRRRTMAAINAEGLTCVEPCPEIYRERAFETISFPQPDCPNAVVLGQTACLIPISPNLDETSVAQMCDALTKVFSAASA